MIKKSGFSLIELMMVIAIVAIIAAVAVPSYQSSVRKGRRVDAQADLMEFSGMAERIYTQTNSYTTAALPDDTDSYTYSFPVAITATTFTIRATPTTAQSPDKCGSMNLTHTGQRTNTGSDNNCW